MYIVLNELLHSAYYIFDGRLYTKTMTGILLSENAPNSDAAWSAITSKADRHNFSEASPTSQRETVG